MLDGCSYSGVSRFTALCNQSVAVNSLILGITSVLNIDDFIIATKINIVPISILRWLHSNLFFSTKNDLKYIRMLQRICDSLKIYTLGKYARNSDIAHVIYKLG